MKIIFATNNRNKLEEVRHALGSEYELLTPRELGIVEEIPEEHDTIEANALQKARYVYGRTGLDCFADDTGLEVAALGGAPGVYSARYAGAGCSAADNVAKLLAALDGVGDRRAQFRTVIALILDGHEYLFEGRVMGEITLVTAGDEGFGYDPVFRPEGRQETLAQMSMSEKNAISHRGQAVRGLAEFLIARACVIRPIG
ncbi:MAG: RdgB/HAM1 family non-canonical purine NTP pyrophosphatase [Rikenellaceae bacterium]|nr:RdgB/HAM1 family non-canonical purine NTP pyrophosphatase [Rikenellaceae bacterium]MCL2693029.1 RdgB/HAM1 family non-canonical purine NTP pyrophosphatase [Rikenellaceae bacterium]